jgi:L-serine dehydratase
MRAAKQFIKECLMSHSLNDIAKVQVRLYGSLSLTGIGHGIDKALVAGLEGMCPDTLDVDNFNHRIEQLKQSPTLHFAGEKAIPFHPDEDIIYTSITLDYHVNGMRFFALDALDNPIFEETFFSVGGGFIVKEGEIPSQADTVTLPYPYQSADTLLQICQQHNKPISEVVYENEKVWRSAAEIDEQVQKIWMVMKGCVERGLSKEGILPGGLNVRRRAKSLNEKLNALCREVHFDNANTMRWLNIFALAVNEENADCGRVVTAPTNGASGVIPSILYYCHRFYASLSAAQIRAFFLTAGGIGRLYKENASISGAEVGCQGEVGVACSMAAGALTELLGGTPRQVENAAEIAMEHHLGMTCDPIGGLVQVPCIERNALAAVRAMNIAQLALMEDGENKVVSLDKVIRTMHKTGQDMLSQYKETAQGGLAVNVIEC